MRPMMVPMGDAEVPHWALLPEEQWVYFENFEEFMCKVWEHLGLPQPTEAQRNIAWRLQYGIDKEEAKALGGLASLLADADVEAELLRLESEGDREDIIRAFRGVGKSYITATFVIWRLMRNPRDEKVLVVSASGGKAKEFVAMVKSLLATMPLLAFIAPGANERNQSDRFDVRGASISQSHSVKAAGITGQITGGRATLIVPDDIEVPENSRTVDARQRLFKSTEEFEAIKLPNADVIYLGTPQTEESIYNRMVTERGYGCYCYPARFPTEEKRKGYYLTTDSGTRVDMLAYALRAKHEAGKLKAGQPTDPQRFDEHILAKREAKGRAFFALQYQLDTTLSDAERYPLRQHDLIVFEVNSHKAPMLIQWGRHNDKKNVIADFPNLGFSGDYLMGPLFFDSEWREYSGSVLWVDPSGRGKDETAWSVVKVLNGTYFLLKNGKVRADPEAAMKLIAKDALDFEVNLVEVEPNYGQGMWVTAFNPIFAQEIAERKKLNPKGSFGCTVQESEWAKGQKEARIIDTLEPVLTQHRLVVSESVLREDAETEDRDYSLLYQMTHITRERGALVHDDRLESLAGAIGSLMAVMALDQKDAAKAQLEDEMDREIEDFIESFQFGGGSVRDMKNPPKVLRSKHRNADGSRDMVYRTWI